MKREDFIKQRHLIILVILIIFGIYLRSYHIDYPTIGYHNMKENIYLMQAYHMYEGGSPFELRMFYFADRQNTFQRDMLPLIAWSTVIMWKLFGMDVLYPRLLMVMLSVANIGLIYWFVDLLTKKRDLALVSAALVTILPISVFFGRNIQPDIPGVTFILLYSIFLYKWIQKPDRKTFVYFIVFLSIAAHIKLTNVAGLIPMAFIFPWKEKLREWKRYIPEGIITVIGLGSVQLWKYIQYITMPDAGNTTYDSLGTEFLQGFRADFWQKAKPVYMMFINEAWTMWFVWLTVIGLLLAAYKWRSKLGKYLIGYLVCLFLYYTFIAGYMKRHSYYEAPFLPMVAIASALTIFFIGSMLYSLLKSIRFSSREVSVYLIALLVIMLSWGSVQKSTDAQFNTLFIGTDAAGDYIREHSDKTDKIFMGKDPSGQTVAMLWAAKRYGAWMPQNSTEFKRLEEEKNFNWVFLYGNALQWTMENYPDTWDYIEDNYRLEHLGAVNQGQGPTPVYLVLKKGGTFNMSDFNSHPLVPERQYEYTYGNVRLLTASRT